jgi:hypothetical protein
MPLQIGQPKGSACRSCGALCQALGEGLSSAIRIAASEPAYLDP